MFNPLTSPFRLLKKVETVASDGRSYFYYSYSTQGRTTGRRIIVRDDSDKIVADTGDQYDIANAINKVDWLMAEILPVPESLSARFEADWVPAGPSIEGVYYKRWFAANATTPEDLKE